MLTITKNANTILLTSPAYHLIFKATAIYFNLLQNISWTKVKFKISLSICPGEYCLFN